MSANDDPENTSDPFAAARAVLEKARDARRASGLPVDEGPIDFTPKTTEQVLEEARRIREEAITPPRQRQREENARAELERLKAEQRGETNEDSPPPAEPTRPRKRRL